MPDATTPPGLAPEFLAVQALLRDSGIVQADVLATPTVVARGHARPYQAFLNQDPPPLARIEERVLDHLSPPLRIRLYYPDGATGPLPAYLHAHGGGFALGDIDSLDRWKREVARDAGVVVVGLDYALAPEQGSTNGAAWLWAAGLGIAADSKHKEEAFKFITWATSRDYAKLVAEKRGIVRMRSRPAKTPEVSAASGASSRSAASNSRPNPRKLSASSSHR